MTKTFVFSIDRRKKRFMIARRRRRRTARNWAFAACAGGLVATMTGVSTGGLGPAPVRIVDERFETCGAALRFSCVVDGDTLWVRGEKIRIADIDTPEISAPQCPAEAERGEAARARLAALLNEGPLEMRTPAGKDEDAYGRKLRTLVRDGRSLGARLVDEGLARSWRGRREGWC